MSYVFFSSPNEDIPLLFHHNKVHTTLLVLAHKRMWDEVEEDVG